MNALTDQNHYGCTQKFESFGEFKTAVRHETLAFDTESI